ARTLLGELPSSDLPDERRVWLAGQLTGLETSARVLAGEPVGFVDQVEAYFQVRPAMGDESAYADAHAQLSALLPGEGSLGERRAAYRKANEVPPDRLGEAVEAVSSLLRDRVRGGFGLPEGETVDYEVVTDRPWSGFNYYLGGLRSRVAINADLPVGLGALPALVAHESYPGHHTEHCRKETGLPGRPELTVFLVNTPECLLAEGLADLGLDGVGLAEGWGPLVQDLYADLGIRYDGELAEQVARAGAPLGSVQQDAALLLHDRGGDLEEVVAHLERWALLPRAHADKAVQFLTDPLWRAYISTYVEGERLLAAWLAARPEGQPVGDRFVRLLDEQLTPSGIRAQL
ncbi:MAG: DUF885 domain-containing protein, partial [Actinomycetota bacterium]|nr:DUF885 domain-containing protein [Actinomycetota bacterium]